MKAVILAAGRGRRLSGDEPKSVLDVGGASLLARMLEALTACGIDEAIVVVGYEANLVRQRALALPEAKRPTLSFLLNPQFTQGSILSLWAARERFGDDDLLVMDADVLFPTPLLRRLVESPHRSAFLLDPRSSAGGEEMMLVAKGGRVLRIARSVDPSQGDRLGEGVGFLKVAREDQPQLEAALRTLVDAGEHDRDYEDAIDRFLGEVNVGYEEVGDLPWTEIDFPEDLERARGEVLDAIQALEPTRGAT